jgi:hypothetical protein
MMTRFDIIVVVLGVLFMAFLATMFVTDFDEFISENVPIHVDMEQSK